MVSQGGIDRQVGEVLSDGLSHVTDHLDHYVCRELTCRDMRWTVTVREGKIKSSVNPSAQMNNRSTVLLSLIEINAKSMKIRPRQYCSNNKDSTVQWISSLSKKANSCYNRIKQKICLHSNVILYPRASFQVLSGKVFS